MYPLTLAATLLSFVPYSVSYPLINLPRGDRVPQCVLDYAPLVWLDAREKYFPGDLTTHLKNIYPAQNYNFISPAKTPLTLSNLDALNSKGSSGTNIYLTSNEGIRALPSWFRGTVPAGDHSTGSATASVIITVSKEDNILDAFYFFFYSYDQGNWVLEDPDLEFGDHVGDWEHVMIRFDSSTNTPQAMWYSQHASGQAFEFDALNKYRHTDRPLVYSARGTHANYATSGDHDHTIPGIPLPGGPLLDHTSEGTLWDPALNSYIYSYDTSSGNFTAFNGNDPVGFLNFAGKWGDKQLPDSAKGQLNVFGQRKYVDGPTGPKAKKLNRTAVCPNSDGCVVRPEIII